MAKLKLQSNHNFFRLINLSNLEMLFQSPANISLFKVNSKNTRKTFEICSKLTIKTPFSCISIVHFEQVNVSWVLVFCTSAVDQWKSRTIFIKMKTFTNVNKLITEVKKMSEVSQRTNLELWTSSILSPFHVKDSKAYMIANTYAVNSIALSMRK